MDILLLSEAEVDVADTRGDISGKMGIGEVSCSFSWLPNMVASKMFCVKGMRSWHILLKV